MISAVVSGGGTGIGKGVARMLAARGDEVLILGRRADVLEAAAAELGPRVHAAPVDLADVDAVAALAERDDLGHVTALVHAAGGVELPPRDGGLRELDAHWQRILDKNLRTSVLLTEALKPRLARPGGRILLISSIAAYRGDGPAYAAAKAALHAYAMGLAAQLGPDGVTANVVAPGFIDDTEFFGGWKSDRLHERLVHQSLVGRAGTPEDVAAAAAYLCSPEAGFVTGQTLVVDGGTLLKG